MEEARAAYQHAAYQHAAVAALIAAFLLIGFAVACWVWFPLGGIAVAGLGGAVAIVGLRSHRPWLAVVSLAAHGWLFALCYLAAL